MHNAVITGTGLYRPPHVITNAELVQAFNAYADLHNAKNADAIAAGSLPAVVHSSVEFIEKASGIRQRYVIDKAGVLDPTRMKPKFEPRADEELSLMAEIAVQAARQAIAAAGKTPADVDAVLCAAANMQRAYPAMACEIQAALGCGGYGFDMNVACSSATFAIEQAVNAVRTGSAKCNKPIPAGAPIATGQLIPTLPLPNAMLTHPAPLPLAAGHCRVCCRG